MFSSLTNFLLFEQIIADWEKSGNGFGQRNCSDDKDYGHFTDEHLQLEEGDNRMNFVKTHLGQRSHHAYFWDISEEVGVLDNVLNVLSDDVAADCDNVPSGTATVQNKRRKIDLEAKEEADMNLRIRVQQSLDSIAVSTKEDFYWRQEKTLNSYCLHLLEAEHEGNTVRAKFYKKMVKDARKKVQQTLAELTKLKMRGFFADWGEDEIVNKDNEESKEDANDAENSEQNSDDDGEEGVVDDEE